VTTRISVPVLIVGAGPVGLMASILLGRLGIASLVVERRAGAQRAPAAHVVNARTFEICRAAGVDMAAIAAACRPPEDGGWVRWMTTLAGDELGALPFERQSDAELAVTPTPLRNLSQHRFEPILLATLRTAPGAEIAYGHEWQRAEQDADGVTSEVCDSAAGRTYQVRSHWLLAADGAGSPVRKSLGIASVGPGRLQSFVMIHFEADLRTLVAARPGTLFWTTVADATGTLVAHDIDSTWVYMHPWDPDRESFADYSESVCAGIVRRALGTSAYPFAIRTISPWTMTAQIAERYRAGRSFLVGDAAHRFPPTGGLGLNTGIQDAHNLVWKLAAVIAGWAPVTLLDTYEIERRPIAQDNADVSLRNAMKMMEAFPTLMGARDGTASRADVAAAIAAQAEHFDMSGLQLGFTYEAGAVVPDGSARPAVENPVRTFVPNARPGARLPHAWLAGSAQSTLDLVAYDRFTLFTGPEGAAWTAAVAASELVPIRCFTVGRDVVDRDGRWLATLGIGRDGALLVRPDQHVAWRSPCAVGDPGRALRDALGAIMSQGG
jgi:2,4-dichlorophenol 6-monooxygenase